MPRRLFLSVLGGVVGLAGLVGLAPAAVVPTAHAAEGSGSILVIMDVSGSMRRADASGTTLIAGARQAVRQLVSEAPGETPIGLRLYGHTYPGDDKQRGCRDTELVVPIGPVSQTGDRIGAAIDAAKPTGFTPIGYSLQQAADDFPPEGKRTIVLVSDGEDTCNTPPPCKAARRLGAQGIDVRVDTVGLFLQGNATAQKQLKCVAKETGGKYYAAEDAGALTQQLTAVSQRAIQRFEASGGAVDGGPAAPQAAPVEPGVAYVDDVRAGEARWYSFQAGTGQVATATLTEDGSTEYGCCLNFRLRGPDYEQLDFENHFNGDGTAVTLRTQTDENGLEETGTYYVEVVLDKEAAPRPVSYQLQVDVSGTAVETATPTPTPTPTPTVTDSPTPTATDTATDADTAAAAVSTGSGDGGDTLLWVLIGVLSLLILVVIAAMAYMYRRMQRQGPTS